MASYDDRLETYARGLVEKVERSSEGAVLTTGLEMHKNEAARKAYKDALKLFKDLFPEIRNIE